MRNDVTISFKEPFLRGRHHGLQHRSLAADQRLLPAGISDFPRRGSEEEQILDD